MSELILVDVPPLDMVLMCLQGQDRWFCGRVLELNEQRAETHTHTYIQHPLV